MSGDVVTAVLLAASRVGTVTQVPLQRVVRDRSMRMGTMEDVEGLVRRLEGRVLWLQIDRPQAGNSFNGSVQRGLIEPLEVANRSEEIRAVVLTATGDRHFCTGPDLRDPEITPDPDRPVGDPARRLRDGSQRMVQAVLDCEKPVVCGLNGMAAGGGA